MKRFAFPLTIILLLFAVIALAAPGDKRPAVTSAAIGLGTNSSATMASVTATTSVTAPAYNSTAADGYHYIRPFNSTGTYAGSPLVGMIQTTPTGPQWYTGSAWEAIGGGGGGTWGSITGTLSAQTDLQAALDAITAGGITISTAIPTTPGAANLNDTTHVLTVASSTGYTQFTGSFTAWDTTPEAFAFTDLTDVALNTTQTAAPVQISGINYPSAVTASGGTAAICTGATADTCGSFSASPGNIANNQYVSAQHTSSASNSTAVNTVVTIGGVSDTFTSTTVSGSVAYSDNFNRANETPIASPWTAVTGAGAINLASNVAQGTSANAAAYYSGTFSGDQYASITSTVWGTGKGPLVRAQSGAQTYYALRATSTTSLQLIKNIAGTVTQVCSPWTVSALASGNRIGISVSGSTFTASVNGVAQSPTCTDSNITGGNPGIYVNGATSVDDWQGGNN